MRNERKLSTKKNNTSQIDPCFRAIAPYWGWINWDEVITNNFPVLKLKFDATADDWALFLAVDALANEADIDFEDAASWVLQRALGKRFADAREMAQGNAPWDENIRHLCRVMSLVLCKLYEPLRCHTIEKVDDMIWSMLISEEELLAEATCANDLVC